MFSNPTTPPARDENHFFKILVASPAEVLKKKFSDPGYNASTE
jgi:hypothetical protein